MPGDFSKLQRRCQRMVDVQLEQVLPRETEGRLALAMRYSVLNGGKRIRPMLCYAASELFGPINATTHHCAAAVEIIHAYSLIHDDLPAMDDDDLRRGKPTCHIAFDEATAILAGDALQALAFSVLADNANAETAATVLSLVQMLSAASGVHGMVGGQALDIAATGKPATPLMLKNMHRLKTGALINASILMGATASGRASDDELMALRDYGDAIGLAFQVKDDILDVESSTEILGKRQGADLAKDKPSYTTLLGVAGAKKKLAELHDRALSALATFRQDSHQLQTIADFIVYRSH